MATKPHTAPIAAAIADGFLFCAQERATQVSAAAAAAVLVTTNALAAREPEASAEPALKPNQPNHNRPAPKSTNGTLFAVSPRFVFCRRWPTKSAAASAEKPADICTTVPPAKSSAPRACSQPAGDHTQCAIGSYTSVVHK